MIFINECDVLLLNIVCQNVILKLIQYSANDFDFWQTEGCY